MSVSPPTQPTFTVGAPYAAPLTFTNTDGTPFNGVPAGLAATSSDPSVTVGISGSSLDATMTAAGVTATLTVSATNALGAVITVTVVISDGPLPVALGSIGIGLFAPVSA